MQLNVKDCILTESKLLLFLSQSCTGTFSSLWSHEYVWAAGVLIFFIPGPFSSGIPLKSGYAYCTCCKFYQTSEPASACLLHCSAVFYSALWAAVFHPSWFAYSFICGQHLSCPLCYLTLFALPALPLFSPTLVPAHCLLLVYSFGSSLLI